MPREMIEVKYPYELYCRIHGFGGRRYGLIPVECPLCGLDRVMLKKGIIIIDEEYDWHELL